LNSATAARQRYLQIN